MTHTFKRDSDTQALVNVDHEGLVAYRKRRDRLRRIDNMQEDIDTLKTKLDLILTLLTTEK